jgi:hypothetical protein
MLTSHPLIVIPPEAGFAVWLYPKYVSWSPDEGYEAFVADLLGTRKFEFWNLDADQIVRSIDAWGPEDYGALVAAVYWSYAGSVKPEATYWGDKNNSYVGEVDLLKTIFPNGRFIHIVRDGRNVAVSYRRLHQREMRSRYAPSLPFRIGDIAEEWTQNVLGVDRAVADLDGHAGALTVRLEDLTDRPTEILSDICRLLDLRFDASMLEYHHLTTRDGGEPTEFLQWKERNTRPVEASDRQEFRVALTAEEIRVFEEIASAALERFGYVG